MIPTASTTEIITSLGTSMWDVLYGNIGIVFGVVAAIALVFYVFRLLLGFLRGGRRA